MSNDELGSASNTRKDLHAWHVDGLVPPVGLKGAYVLEYAVPRLFRVEPGPPVINKRFGMSLDTCRPKLEGGLITSSNVHLISQAQASGYVPSRTSMMRR